MSLATLGAPSPSAGPPRTKPVGTLHGPGHIPTCCRCERPRQGCLLTAQPASTGTPPLDQGFCSESSHCPIQSTHSSCAISWHSLATLKGPAVGQASSLPARLDGPTSGLQPGGSLSKARALQRTRSPHTLLLLPLRRQTNAHLWCLSDIWGFSPHP